MTIPADTGASGAHAGGLPPGAMRAGDALRRGGKSAGAFRTISEVADDLNVPQHVLRFWETRFAQIRPLKRAGGRRYYRPEDVDLLRRIRELLYNSGYTIKGVQRLLRDAGRRPDGETPAPAEVSAAALPSAEPVRASAETASPANAVETAIADLAAVRDLLRRLRR
jgi:DNA-binding transcriptional MerR regulator